MPEASPVVVVLATYNGMPWLPEQVETILGQEDVSVHLVVSDDGSSDGTQAYLEQLSRGNPRVTILPQRTGSPGVIANFLYAVSNAPMGSAEFLALSDQDDLWQPRKLAEQISFLLETGADAVSSNVFAFAPGKGGYVIHKDSPQTRWDFLFEAPGPGSTFLMTRRALTFVRSFLAENELPESVDLHDWFIYAILRSAGFEWAIDPRPHVAYRQHSGNTLGVHRGRRAILRRYKKLRSGHYRASFQGIAQVSAAAGALGDMEPSWFEELSAIRADLNSKSIYSRMRLAGQWKEMRRSPMDKITFAAALILGVW